MLWMLVIKLSHSTNIIKDQTPVLHNFDFSSSSFCPDFFSLLSLGSGIKGDLGNLPLLMTFTHLIIPYTRVK